VTPEEAICQTIPTAMDPIKVQGWDYDAENHELIVLYQGDCGVSEVSIRVEVHDTTV